jgi:lipoyl-dependent peroxiredoxin subunit D
MSLWVDRVKESIPEHSKDVKLTLDTTFKSTIIDEVDLDACALAAAISAGNGELAYAIESGGVLVHSPLEAAAAKTAASLMGMNNVYYPFVEMTGDVELKNLPAGIRMQAYVNHAGVSKRKFEMYALCASIVGKCNHCVKNHYEVLKKEGMTTQELQLVGKIAAVINAIGKVTPV